MSAPIGGSRRPRTTSRAARAACAAIILSVLLAGCSLRGGESRGGVDRGEYEGGTGLAVALRNDAADPIEVEVYALDAAGRRHAEQDLTLAPGESVEKWYTLEGTRFSLRMVYHWDGPGEASTGLDDVDVDLQDCPLVSRVAFVFGQDNVSGQVGHATAPTACVAADE